MAKHKLAYLPSAEADILGIVEFYASQLDPTSAREIYYSIREQIVRLQDVSLLAAPSGPGACCLGYRKLVLTKTYVAVYRLMDDTVPIYRVVNGKTDYPKLLK